MKRKLMLWDWIVGVAIVAIFPPIFAYVPWAPAAAILFLLVAGSVWVFWGLTRLLAEILWRLSE